MQREFRGEITVFLSMLFILLISFVAGLIESASIQVLKNYKRADMQLALESVFGEFHKDLWERYDLLAIESTYETGNFSLNNITERLRYYGADGTHNLKALEYLTDLGGRTFYHQVVTMMETKYGGLISGESAVSNENVWNNTQLDSEEYMQLENETQGNLEQILKEEKVSLPTEKNPLEVINNIKKVGILPLIVPEEEHISNKQMDIADLPSNRKRNEGTGNFPEQKRTTGAISNLYFCKYLSEHFQHAANPNEQGALSYELEYLITGLHSDKENLEQTANKIMMLRFAPNYLYIQSDGKMKAEAETMALTLTSAFGLPLLSEVVHQAILLAWAFGECIMDIRSLLAGNKVPLFKTQDSWHLKLEALLNLGTKENCVEQEKGKAGLTYGNYLEILLNVMGKDLLSMRSLDLMEKNLQVQWGHPYFRIDQCVIKLKYKSTSKLRRGIVYDYTTYFGYRYQ